VGFEPTDGGFAVRSVSQLRHRTIPFSMAIFLNRAKIILPNLHHQVKDILLFEFLQKKTSVDKMCI
ncbi:MAG: hypothetical protein PHS83_06720, partial [Clostridia bacterium]|nr:hypothetical protein [Clostridia bacterium]